MQAYTQAKKDLIHLSYIFHLLPHTHTTCIKTETCKLMFKGMQSLSPPTQHCKGKKKHTSCIILSLRGEKGQRHPMTVKLLMKLCQGFSWLSLVKKEKERKKTAEDQCQGRLLTTITPVSQSCSKNTWAQGWWHKREENENRGTQVSFSSFYLLQDYQFHHIKGRPFSLQHISLILLIILWQFLKLQGYVRIFFPCSSL